VVEVMTQDRTELLLGLVEATQSDVELSQRIQGRGVVRDDHLHAPIGLGCLLGIASLLERAGDLAILAGALLDMPVADVHLGQFQADLEILGVGLLGALQQADRLVPLTQLDVEPSQFPGQPNDLDLVTLLAVDLDDPHPGRIRLWLQALNPSRDLNRLVHPGGRLEDVHEHEVGLHDRLQLPPDGEKVRPLLAGLDVFGIQLQDPLVLVKRGVPVANLDQRFGFPHQVPDVFGHLHSHHFLGPRKAPPGGPEVANQSPTTAILTQAGQEYRERAAPSSEEHGPARQT